jgi:hypothetical protein
MSISKKMKAKINMIELGILPAFTGSELTEMLNSLSKDEKRKVKRKFRKIWKKLVKERPDIEGMLVPDAGGPTKAHLRNRSVLVTNKVIRDTANLKDT